MPRVNIATAEVSLATYGKLVKSTKAAPNSEYVIDVAGLRDPMSNRGFKKKFTDGRPGEVQKFVQEDPRVNAIIDTVRLLVEAHVRSKAQDKTWLSVSFRDHHGKWIAPAIGEIVADVLALEGYRVSLYHADLDERG